MAPKLRQSTAVTIQVGPFLDSTDGVTAETGLTIAQADVRLSKAGAVFAQKNDTGSATHDENGFYRVALNTTDTNTVGPLKVAVFESGAVPVWETFEVVPANEYDSSVAGTDVKQVDITQVTGTGVTNVDDFKADVSALATAAALATVDANVDSILVDTGTGIPAQISGLNDLSQAEANAACDQALADYDGPTNAELVARTLLAADYFNPATDDVNTNAASRTASQADVSNLDVAVSTRSSHSAADVWAATTRTLTSFGTLVADTALAVWAEAVRTVTGGTVTASNMRGTDDAATAAGQVAMQLDIDAILVDTGTDIPALIGALADFDPEADELENGKSYADMFRIMKAILAGRTTSNGLVFRDDADTKARATVTVDANQNRTSVTLDGS